jgi:CheY-like chemotaxis protein
MMDRQVAHMVRLVDDLLEISRITRGKIDLRKTRVDLAAVIQAAVETSRPLVEASSHALSVALPEAPLFVEGDTVRLTQVFANLLNNAAKYTDDGGHIDVSAGADGTHAVIEVRDSGVGIDAQALPRVFDMFMQVDAERGRAQGGLGIGLTLARNIAQMHGGSVSAHSEGLGRGSRFVVRLPRLEAQDVAAAEPAAVGALDPLTRVMVVDDNRDAADTLGTLLGVLGAEVRVTHCGAEALDVFADYRPEVVLLDLGMPDMDGYEVARRIRERPDSSEVTIIALSGWGQESDRRSSQAAGFDHHLVKPADLGALQALINSRARPSRSPR